MDPAKNRLIDKIQRIEKIYNKNLKRIFKLIEKYNKGNRHIIRVQEILTIIDGYNSNDLLIKETGPYINKFEQPILDEKIQFLYEYNYEKYIIEGTQEQTEELIRHMINLIRDSWTRFNEVHQNKFKLYIQTLLLKYKEWNKYSARYEKKYFF